MTYIKNATIWTMAGEDYDNGSLLLDGAKIVAVGRDIPQPSNARVIDLEGGIVMPGMVDGHCHIGIFGEASSFHTLDINENSNPATPFLRGIDAVNPQDAAFREALESGVTAVCTGPGSTNVICGTFTVMKTYGRSADDMALLPECAMKVALGENPKRVYGGMQKSPFTRMGNAAIFREKLQKAKEYLEKKELGEKEPKAAPEYDFQLESLIKVLKREMPLKIHAHRADDICTAMRLAEEFHVDCTIDHCTEGYKLTGVLKGNDAKAMVGPMILDRCKVELGDSRTDNVVQIANAGIDFCIVTDSPCVNVKHLYVQAGHAVSLGLDEREALRAITIYPAKMLGVSDRIGSVEPGKDADLVFLTGHLFDMESRVRAVMVDGQIVHGSL